jgi:hypothetical protein
MFANCVLVTFAAFATWHWERICRAPEARPRSRDTSWRKLDCKTEQPGGVTGPWILQEYSGTWSSAVSLPPQSRMSEMLESALRAVVNGTWKSGSYSGSWSIRATP